MNKFETLCTTLLEGLDNTPAYSPVYPKYRYIFFADDKELYQVNPYKLIADTDPIMKKIPREGWNEVRVVDGDTIVQSGEEADDINRGEWYIVRNSSKNLWDQSYRALVLP